MNRRTLSAALQTGDLTEQALDFVKGSPAKAPGLTDRDPPSPPPDTGREPKPGMPEPRPNMLARPEPHQAPDSGLVSITVRVPRIVPPGLLLASVDRKLKRQRPWTQQEIVAEALTGWLRAHGYVS